MWLRVALVLVLALPWFGPVGAASAPVDDVLGPSADLGSVVITAGASGTTSVESGQPAIDFRSGSAGGLPPGTVVDIGSADDPLADHAFALENRGDAAAQVALHYEYNRAPPTEAGVSFVAYDATGTRLAGGDGALSVALHPGQSAYVVVTVSTQGTTPQDDLSGSLAFRVTTRDRPGQ